jgi:hypothetical protein
MHSLVAVIRLIGSLGNHDSDNQPSIVFASATPLDEFKQWVHILTLFFS